MKELTVTQEQPLGPELRSVVQEKLRELMAANPKIVALDADLSSASLWQHLSHDFPERFINMGIAEANMIGVASGLSITGYTPWIHSFAPFVTRRVFDQLYLSGGYAQTTLNIYGSDPGFCVGPNGGTHTSFEDVALVRSIPHAVICDASDNVQMAYLVEALSKESGIHYLRGNRKAVHQLYPSDERFEIGQAKCLRKGQDILLVATGQLVYETLLVAQKLAAKGISVEVLDMFTIKPLDEKQLAKSLKGKGLIMTIENHSITGGLGSTVAEYLAEHPTSIAFERIGVVESFGQVGAAEELQKAFNLDENGIEQQVMAKWQKVSPSL